MLGHVTQVILELIAGKAANSKDYKTANSTTVFRTSKSMGRLGAFTTIATVVFAILAVLNAPPHILCWLSFMALCSLLGPPLFITYLVLRVYVDDHQIMIRNAFGLKKHIRWQDVKCVYPYDIWGDYKICSEDKNIKIGSYLSGFRHLKGLIEKNHPGAFDTDTVLNWRDFKTGNAAVFKKTPAIGVLGAFLTLFAFGFMWIHSEKLIDLISQILLVVVAGGCGIYMLLTFFVSRVFVDSENIIYRNPLGIDKQILWQNIKSARVCRSSNSRDFQEYIQITGTDKAKIKIDSNFCGYKLIKDVIRRYYPKGLK